MPRDIRHLLFVGIYNSVVALDARDGGEVWRAKLGGQSFVTVHWDGEELFASAKGEAFRLDPRTGGVVWHNRLKGMGLGSVTMASTRSASQASTSVVPAERKRQSDAAASAAT